MKLMLRMAQVSAAICLFGSATLANATMVSPPAAGSKTLLYSASTLVTAPTVTVTRLEFATAGTLQVSLTDLAWTDVASSLSFSLSEPTRALERLTGSGVLAYEIAGPMTLFASVYAAPRANSGALYHLRMTFSSAVPAVPLPAAFWLLMSGIGAVWTFLGGGRKHIGTGVRVQAT